MSIQVFWELPYGEAIALGLEERIVSEIPDIRNFSKMFLYTEIYS